MSVDTRENVTLRRREAADDRIIADIAQHAFGEYSREAREHTLAIVRARDAATIVALEDEVVVGFVTVHFNRNSAFVSAIAVTRTRRGTGIGQRLMIAAERLARQSGAVQLTLCTAESNLAALDLFLKQGFVIERRPGRQYPRGQPLCRLCKRLAG